MPEQVPEDVDVEDAERAAKEFVTQVTQRRGVVDTMGFVDVDPAEVMRVADEPDFAYVHMHRVDGTGRQMRLKVVFNQEVDDIALGLAYQSALRDVKATKETRQRIQRKLWKACVLEPVMLHEERFYDKMKPQARAEIDLHCLVRLGLENARLSGLGQDAYVPAGTLVATPLAAPEPPLATDATPAPPARLPESSAGSELTMENLTPSGTSATSPAGTVNDPSKSFYTGPPKSSKRHGRRASPNASQTG